MYPTGFGLSNIDIINFVLAGWKSATRRGRFERYLQVYFGNVTLVTKVYIRRGGDGTSNTFQLLHSDDGINWKTGEKVMLKI